MGIYAEVVLCKNAGEAEKFRAELKKLNDAQPARYAELEPLRRNLASRENAISETYWRARRKLESKYEAWRRPKGE